MRIGFSRCVLATTLLTSACAAPLAGPDEALEVEEATGESGEELRIAGVATDSAITPWTRRPTVFMQTSYAAVGADFKAQQDAISDIDQAYYPSLLASAKKAGSSSVYVGAWHKDRRVGDARWDRDIALEDFGNRYEERKAEGFEFFDFSVHMNGDAPRFNGVWVKREGQRASTFNWKATEAQLLARIDVLKADGYRPKRIAAFDFADSTRYLGLFVKDGLTDFRTLVGESATEIGWMDQDARADGYVMTDISAYNANGTLEYSAIWLKNSEVRGVAYDADMTEAEFRDKNEDFLGENMLLVDLNVFYDAAGTLKYAAVWHRTEVRDSLQSNLSFVPGQLNELNAAIASFRNHADVGSKGRFGLFVQNLVTGSWIGFNMNEPFYMGSTTKLLLAAKVIDDPEASFDPLSLRPSDWRGEGDRGFAKADFNGSTYPLETFLDNMLDQSDSASTDRLWGMVDALDPGGLRRYLRSELNLQNVGEITTICELDKRMQLVNDPCVMEMSCDTFEAFLRDDDNNYNASASEKSCMALLDASPGDGEHVPYYATLANSITPVEYGRALRDLTGNEMSNSERERFWNLLDDAGDDGYDADEGSRYEELGTKGGSKRKAKAQVGVMWDWDDDENDFSRITHRYSFAVFAERFATSSYDPEPAMRLAVQHAIRVLDND